jgi:surfeit locus 1 family protein
MSFSGRSSLAVGMVAVAAACAGLGWWQLRRLGARKAANAEAREQRLTAELDLNAGALPVALTNRRVTARGQFDEASQFLLRGRAHAGTPGIHVVTPLRLAGRDTAILVNRGFVPTTDAGPPGYDVDFSEAGEATVRGVALAVPDAGDGAPLETARGESWGRLDLTAMRARVPYPLAPVYVIATETPASRASAGRGGRLPVRIEPPPLDNGPHLSYAIQWFLIGVAALAFGVVYARRSPRS